MPRQAQGARLYLRRDRIDRKSGKPLPDVWVIRDRSHEVSTGYGPESVAEAEAALGKYIASKHAPGQTLPTSREPRPPSSVLIADVVAYYAGRCEANPAKDLASITGFLEHILAWWGDKTCGDIYRSNCLAYVAFRTTQPNRNYTKDPDNAPRVSDQTARRELEELQSAVADWDGEYPFTQKPAFTLPEKSESPRDAMTRPQAAALLLAAMGWRKDPESLLWSRNANDKSHRMHMRRFILIGLYTGPRQTVIRRLIWVVSLNQAWVDLDSGVIWRRGKAEKDHKTKRRTVVKIPKRLLAHMRRWYRLDMAENSRRRERDPDAPLMLHVLHYGWKPLSGKVRTGFEGCVRDAGLDPEITPHWMRHTAATWLMMAGSDMYKAAGFLGMTVATLEKHYAHHRPDFQDEAAGAIGRKA